MMLFRDEAEDDELLPFADRAEAGRILGAKLVAYSRRADVIVLGLPRGGVPVAYEVARVLNVPLDALVVRKLGTPWQRELAMGAVAPGDVQVLDLSIVKQFCVSSEAVEEVAAAERKELERQEQLYRGNRQSLSVAGKTVILVDDGIATGSCILAAIGAARKQGAAHIVVAVPVAPANACSVIRMEADEVISVAEPEMFLAVSQWYEDFSQTSDEKVRMLLEKARTSSSRPLAA
jgi:putative phosphoribosyl transferase